MRLRALFKEASYTTAMLCGVPAVGRSRMRDKLLVLTYHTFCSRPRRSLHYPMPIERFRAQLRFLRKHYRPIDLGDGIDALVHPKEDVGSGESRRPMVAITVDDGFLDNHELMFPVVRQLGVPVTIFLATDFLDSGRPPWPTQVGEILERTLADRTSYPFSASLKSFRDKGYVADRIKRLWKSLAPTERRDRVTELGRHLGINRISEPRPLGWEQVRQMRAAGICFGSHTVFHSILPAVSKDVVWKELTESKQRLEYELKTPCTTLAYPDGAWDSEVETLAKQAGYRTALTQDKGVNDSSLRLLALKRLDIPYNERLGVFACRTAMVTV